MHTAVSWRTCCLRTSRVKDASPWLCWCITSTWRRSSGCSILRSTLQEPYALRQHNSGQLIESALHFLMAHNKNQPIPFKRFCFFYNFLYRLSTGPQWSKYLLSSLVGWLLPALLVITAGLIDRLDIPDMPYQFKPGFGGSKVQLLYKVSHEMFRGTPCTFHCNIRSLVNLILLFRKSIFKNSN